MGRARKQRKKAAMNEKDRSWAYTSSDTSRPRQEAGAIRAAAHRRDTQGGRNR